MKPFKFSLIIISIALFSLLMGCSSNSPTPTSNSPTPTPAFQIPSTYTTYTDETSLFSLSYPGQWEPMSDIAQLTANVKETLNNLKAGLSIEKATILYMAGLKNASGYDPSVNVVVEPMPSGISSVDQVANMEINGLKKVDPNYQEISRTKLVVNGKNAVLIEYKAHFSTTGSPSHNLVLVTLSGSTAWAVTCGSTSDEIFNQWSNDFNNIVRSFKIAD